MNKYIPLSIPNFEGNESKYVNDALSQGWVSTGGAYITQLEQKMSEFLNTHSVAACQSGTSAIHMALVDCGVEPGDIVIVPSLTFIAAVNPVRYQFADSVFMDCDDSLCIDPVKLRQFCEEECELVEVQDKDFIDENSVNKTIILRHKKTKRRVKAIILVHVFGNMADMESIMDTAGKYHLKVIEDATEALGTYYTEGRYKGRFAGTIGDYGAYSFNGNKIITTGGGGAVTANSKETVDHLRFLSTQAKTDPHYYIHDEIGFNYRMTNLQAALGVAQMEELPEFIKRKNANYELYKKAFDNCELCRLLDFRQDIYSNKWFYSLEINRSPIKASMREIITALDEKGVQTRAIWGLIHEQKPYRDNIAYKIEKAKYYSERILNIPCSTNLKKEDAEYVAKTVKQVLGEFAK